MIRTLRTPGMKFTRRPQSRAFGPLSPPLPPCQHPSQRLPARPPAQRGRCPALEWQARLRTAATHHWVPLDRLRARQRAQAGWGASTSPVKAFKAPSCRASTAGEHRPQPRRAETKQQRELAAALGHQAAAPLPLLVHLQRAGSQAWRLQAAALLHRGRSAPGRPPAP